MDKSSAANTEAYWKKISFISFILAIMVVIRHNSTFANYALDGKPNIQSLIKGTITEIAVPMFFAISGFNFFNGYDIAKQKSKMLRRVKSLLIPYVVWNTIYCIFAIITSYTPLSSFFVGREKFVLTFKNVVFSCLFHEGCNGHFWFIFTLMLFVVINPVVFLMIKRKAVGFLSIAVMFFCIFLLKIEVPGTILYRTDVFFYYLIGAFLAVHYGQKIVQGNIGENIRNTIFVGATCIIPIMVFPGIVQGGTAHGIVKMLCIISGMYGIWVISGKICEHELGRLPSSGTVFFIYASHGIIQPIIVKLLYIMLPKSYSVCLINFVLSLTITIFSCIGFRKILNRYFPRLDKVLVGWRA